ncbi:OmpA family protein [Parabacteroides chinchillae]|uniref:OmpA family protein n=1 Tax=Parabacteroides chinchillae TaxID=871327 RepID=A0A8G2BWA0_9BACT|nr:OmpA family protein [Parabacteroides chinchillae]SEF79429.1 OmpA family protein [Parabacteroides chinchillae]
MKTKILLLALLSGFVFSVSAQEFQPQVGFSTEKGYKTNFKKNRARDNWFISVAGGASILLGDQNNKADFGNRLNFAPQFSFGKWFNPYLAFRTQFNGGILHGFVGDNAQLMQHNKYVAGHVDLLWDVTNFWGVYNESRVFHFIPWVGFGYAQRFKTTEAAEFARSESPSLNAGILMAFRVSKRVDINIEAQGSLLNEQFNRVEMNHLSDGIAQVSAGLTFKLGKTDFEVLQPMDYNLLNDLNNQINSLRAANDELSKRPVSCPECEEVVTEVVNNYVDNIVYFRLNSAKIDKNQQINIYNTAEFMKNNKTPIKVIGYADKDTGTSKYNMSLSEKRAKAVAKELIDKYGIPSEQISIEWRGSDVQPYGVNNWNRVVIMSANN